MSQTDNIFKYIDSFYSANGYMPECGDVRYRFNIRQDQLSSALKILLSDGRLEMVNGEIALPNNRDGMRRIANMAFNRARCA